MVSTRSIRMMEINSWILILVEKTRLSCFICPFPNSNVRKRVTAVLSGDEIIENITTTPPTTLYTPKSTSPSSQNNAAGIERHAHYEEHAHIEQQRIARNTLIII